MVTIAQRMLRQTRSVGFPPADRSTGCPHSRQNFACEGTSAPQAVHLIASPPNPSPRPQASPVRRPDSAISAMPPDGATRCISGQPATGTNCPGRVPAAPQRAGEAPEPPDRSTLARIATRGGAHNVLQPPRDELHFVRARTAIRRAPCLP